MSPSSPGQYAGHLFGRLPEPEEVRAGIWSIAVPFQAGVPYTLCYVIADSAGGVHLIDPGADGTTNRELLARNLASIGIGLDDIRSVTASHLHRDHLGLASWLVERNSLALQLHAADAADLVSGTANSRYSTDVEALGERWGVPPSQRHRLKIGPGTAAASPIPERVSAIEDGDVLPIAGRILRVVHTPGHSRGHVCFSLPEEGLLFSGDHILPHLNPGIGRGGRGGENPVAEYLLSLDRLAPNDGDETAPGHGYRFLNLGARRLQIRAHVLRRAGEVADALKTSPNASTWSLASALSWGPGWGNLSATRLQSALAQTDMYVEFVRALPDGFPIA